MGQKRHFRLREPRPPWPIPSPRPSSQFPHLLNSRTFPSDRLLARHPIRLQLLWKWGPEWLPLSHLLLQPSGISAHSDRHRLRMTGLPRPQPLRLPAATETSARSAPRQLSRRTHGLPPPLKPLRLLADSGTSARSVPHQHQPRMTGLPRPLRRLQPPVAASGTSARSVPRQRQLKKTGLPRPLRRLQFPAASETSARSVPRQRQLKKTGLPRPLRLQAPAASGISARSVPRQHQLKKTGLPRPRRRLQPLAASGISARSARRQHQLKKTGLPRPRRRLQPPAPAQEDWASPPPQAAPAPGGFGDFGSFGPPPAADLGGFEPAPGAMGAFASPDLGSAPDPFASFGAAQAGPSPAPPSASVDPRITQFLKQGDEAMSRGQVQEAIDLWSRVYLIDLSNDEATRRIDQAREKQAATAQRVDMLVSEGMQAYERGEMEAARAKFLEVQALSPNDAAAQSYLSQIEAALSSAPSPFETGAAQEAPQVQEDSQYAEEASWQPQGEGLEMPSEGVAEPKRAELPAKAFKVDKRILIGAGAAAILLLAVGGYFVLGPKPKPADTPPPITKKGPDRPVGEDLLGKAQALFEQGRVDEALQILVGIPDTDPRHADALIMIDRFKTTAIPTPPAAVSSENLDELKSKGMAAIRDSRYLDAVKSLDPFVKARPDDSEAALALARAREELSALAPALKAYNEQDYATAVKLLWPLYSKDKKNKDMEEFLFRAFFNEGIQKMQAGDFTESFEAFKSASAIRSQDSDLQRHMRFTKKYPQGPTDLMARIYVKHAAPKL